MADFSDAYQRELDALRRLAIEFAADHPKIARRLRLNATAVDDPHVERLLEGVAFLTARSQQRLDDEFPEITDAMLGILHPHYLAPVPSAAIVRLRCKPDLVAPVDVPVGAMLESDPVAGVSCRFRTTMPVRLWPIEAGQARMSGLPLAAPSHPLFRLARSSLRVTLRLTNPDARFEELAPPTLRFFIRGSAGQSIQLYEMLCQHCIGLAVADGPNDDRPTPLPRTALQSVGFGPDEALYPWSKRSFAGFRLLTEYFALPEKFLFVDVNGVDARTLIHNSAQLELFFYFDVSNPELERMLDPQTLCLGCVPVINLFSGRCEPIRLDHWRTDYVIYPDYRRRGAEEVWGVEQVREIGQDGSFRNWRPLYQRLLNDDVEPAGFYTLIRRPAATGLGIETRLAPVDLHLSLDQPADRLLSVDALLTNRDLPSRLPFGGGEPRLHAVEGLGAVTAIECLTPPTPSWRPPLREHHSWRLISHLVLSRLSLTGSGEGASRLRELISLYDVRNSEETQAAIASLLSVESQEAIARVPGARPGAFGRGLDTTLVFDTERWDESGLYLMCAVLERVLALHATVNSFVRTTARLRGRPDPVAHFKARAGHRALL